MNKQKPYISVIIPTYNRAAYLADAIQSVLEQKNAPWPMEVIVVDDGSTDNTRQLVTAMKHSAHYVHISHSGLPAVARNVGAATAKGRLLAFLDSDDSWTTDKLALQLPTFEDPGVVLSYANAEICDERGQKVGPTIITPEQAHAGRVFENLLQENFVSTLTVMVRKSAFDKVGGFNESKRLRGVEDYHLWLRLAGLGAFVYVNKSLALYRKHQGNISANQLIGSLKLLQGMYVSLKHELPQYKALINRRLSILTQDMAHISKQPKSTIYRLQSALYRKNMS